MQVFGAASRERVAERAGARTSECASCGAGRPIRGRGAKEFVGPCAGAKPRARIIWWSARCTMPTRSDLKRRHALQTDGGAPLSRTSLRNSPSRAAVASPHVVAPPLSLPAGFLDCAAPHSPISPSPLLMAPPPQPKQLVLAASSADAGVAAWDLRTGAEDIRLRPCASRPRSLASVADRFLASAQALPAGGNSGTIHFYYWDKPQVAVKSFPAEPIRALIADQEGSYLIGGGSNGNMFLWEVSTGELRHTWHAHYRAVRCLALYDYLLVSGSEDGSIKVWDLITVLDEQSRLEVQTPYLYSFSQHALPVTDIACFLGAIAISSSEDRTCKIWSLSEGRMLRSISFPTSIGSIALDPRSHIFYAGGRDGKIYVTAMGVDLSFHGSDESSILGTLDDHSKAVTSLASSTDGLLLVSGSEDGNVRVWDTRCQQVTRKFKHSQGPVTNVLIVTPQRVNLPMLQPLRKVCSANGEAERQAVVLPRPENDVPIPGNKTSIFMERYLDELQKHGGSSRLFDFGLNAQNGTPNQQGTEWRDRYLELQDLFVHEVLHQMPSSRNP